jgi:peptidoglycan/LPS O-acetylase OafA/YrhL
MVISVGMPVANGTKIAAADSPTISSRPSFEIPTLDGFRAISFLIVFLSHTKFNGLIPGGFGVTVFFFLSGYLITSLLRREAESTGRISLRNFYIRRTLRILPPVYVTMGICLVLIGLGWLWNDPLRWQGLLAQGLQFTNYYMIFGPPDGHRGYIDKLGSMWSLAVEEHFYLIFPILYIGLRRWTDDRRKQAAVLLAMWAAISLWRCVLVFFLHAVDHTVQRASLATDTRVDSILIGCILAIYANPFMHKSRLSDGKWKLLLVAGIVALLVSFYLPGDRLRESIRYSIQNWALIPIFVCGIRHPDWLIFRGLNLRWVKFIGVLSYSLYLIHNPMLGTCEHMLTDLPIWGRQVAAFVLSFLTAVAIYVVIERPCAKLRKRYT